MHDFVKWCQERNLIEVANDGTVTWKEDCNKTKTDGGKKVSGVRDACKDDLSGDYKGHFHHMGKVWPFKVLASGKNGKPVAPVGK